MPHKNPNSINDNNLEEIDEERENLDINDVSGQSDDQSNDAFIEENAENLNIDEEVMQNLNINEEIARDEASKDKNSDVKIEVNSEVNIIEDYFAVKNSDALGDDEEIEVELVDSAERISNTELVENMMINAGVDGINVNENDIVPERDVAPKVERKTFTAKDVELSTSNCRKQTKMITGMISFSDLPADQLEYLDKLGIHDAYSLLKTPHADHDPTVKKAKDNLIGSKRMNESDLMNAAVLFNKMQADIVDHSSLSDTESYKEESKAFGELEIMLHSKGINTMLATTLLNPDNNDHFNSVKKKMLDQMNEKSKKRFDDLTTVHEENKKLMMNILKITDDSAIVNSNSLRMSRRQSEDEVDEAAENERNTITDGAVYLQPNELEKAITHLANQEDFLSKMNPKDPHFYDYKKSFETQKEWLLQKGIPYDSVNKMLNYKIVENIAKQQELLQNTKKGSSEYKELSESIDKQCEYLYAKGIKRDDLPGLIESKAKEGYQNEMAELSNVLEAKMRTGTPMFENLDGVFYERIANVFDAKHHEKGLDLNENNLKETAHILKEMKLYSKQLALNGKIAESSKINEHIVKIGKFLVAKGISKEDLKDLSNATSAEIDKKCTEILQKKAEKEASATNEEKVADENKKQIEVNIGENKVKDFNEIEQFTDVKQVIDVRNLDQNKINEIVNENNQAELSNPQEELNNSQEVIEETSL